MTFSPFDPGFFEHLRRAGWATDIVERAAFGRRRVFVSAQRGSRTLLCDAPTRAEAAVSLARALRDATGAGVLVDDPAAA